MIKEFWQERREEKKRLKQLKKENKKLPKTREQKAYKVFGVLFVLFMIFGSIGFACRGGGEDVDYSWENVVGITDEMKTQLTARVDKNTLVTSPIDAIDWGMAKDELGKVGLDGIIVDNNISTELLLEGTQSINGNMVCSYNVIGAIVDRLIESDDYAEYIELLQVTIMEDGSDIYLESVMSLDLSLLVYETALPIVYVKSTSMLDVLDNELSALGTKIRINNIDEELNDEIVDTINENSYFDISFFTNTLIVNEINNFAEYVNAKIQLQGTKVILAKK